MPALGQWGNGLTAIDQVELNKRDSLLRALGADALIPPAVPNAKDDEFDGTSVVSWTNTPTAATVADIDTSVRGALYLNYNSTNFVGRLQPIPAAYPFTLTTRVRALSWPGNYKGYSLIVAPAAPTSASLTHGPNVFAANNVWSVDRLTTTFAGGSQAASSSVVLPYGPCVYLRLIMTSATSMTSQVSFEGQVWQTLESGFTPSFTPGVMGLVASANGASEISAAFDFFRVS